MIKDNQSYKIVHDPGTNSVRYVIDTAKSTIMQELEYDEYGNIMKNTNPTFQPLGFAGGLRDNDTTLIRFGARDYDSTVGRWTTKDPSGFNGGTTNLYEYSFSNPMSYVDPDGRHPIAAAFGSGFVIGAFSGYSIQNQINPNSPTAVKLRAALEGGLITGSSTALGALTATSALVAGALTATGLSFNFLSAPSDAGVNMQDLSGGINYFQNLNQRNKKNNPCPNVKGQ